MKWKKATKQWLPPLALDFLLRGGRDKIEPVVGMPYSYYKKVRKKGYIEENFHEKFVNYLHDRLKKDSKFLDYLFNEMYRVCSSVLAHSKMLHKIDFSKKSDSDMKRIFREAIDKLEDMSLTLWTPLAIETLTVKLIKEELEKRLDDKEKIDEYFLVLTSITRESFAGKAQKELLNIAIKLQQHKEIFEKDVEEIKKELGIFNYPLYKEIEDHYLKNRWMNVKFGFGFPYKLDDFIKRLKTLVNSNPEKQLKEAEEKKALIKEETERILEEFDNDFRDIVRITKENVFFRTYRLEVYGLAGYYLIPFFTELGKRLGVSYEGLFLLLCEEIIDSNVDFTKIQDRMGEFGYVLENGNMKLYTGKDVDEVDEKEEIDENIKEIKGEVANKGKAKGVVKIIKDKSELSKVNKGDIMVAEFTTPDFVPAMEKAAAIVTDIGGITSHSAIISRELGIPSVIGTNIATKVLQDGDLVEVDAEKGVVRKIE
jgi:phosphohistidine swiveling domain-containing protein